MFHNQLSYVYLGIQKKIQAFLISSFIVSNFAFQNADRGPELKKVFSWMVWMKLDGVIELNNGNYIAFFTWATEKMFHVLIILTHHFESYCTCFKDKENGLLKVLLFMFLNVLYTIEKSSFLSAF